jgi:hypothetical protein
MSSIEEVRKQEVALEESIVGCSFAIEELHRTIAKDKTQLHELSGRRYFFQENAFEKLYGKDAAQVRKDYVDLLTKCSGSCSSGHKVKVPGYDYDKRHVASHICFLCKHYEVCKPTPLIIEAFAVVGQEVWIEPKPHKEHWGN